MMSSAFDVPDDTPTRALLEPIAGSLGATPQELEAFMRHVEGAHWYRCARDLRLAR